MKTGLKTILLCFFIQHSFAQAPTIASFSPTSGPIGTSLTLTGTNFSPTSTNDIVYFGGAKAVVTNATTNSLTVTVPAGTTYQPISVTTNNLTGYSLRPFNLTFVNTDTAFNANSFTSRIDLPTGQDQNAIVMCDFDGDGKLDLATPNFASAANSISVLRNTSINSIISFANYAGFETGVSPYNIAIGDIDGDGKQDVITVNQNYGDTNGTVSVLRNVSILGTISFAQHIDFNTGTNPESVAVADIDGDGKPDLAIVNSVSNTISVFLNTTTPNNISFAPRIDIHLGLSVVSIAIGDLDGDGKPDLAVVCKGCYGVIPLLNQSTIGNVSFKAGFTISTGTDPTGVSIGDLDADGKADLVVANYQQIFTYNNAVNSISILRNTSTVGNISFAPNLNYDFATTVHPYNVSIGDLNGDGIPDLAVANASVGNSLTISLFINQSAPGNISLKSLVSYNASGANDIAIGDLDGDGKPDLATSNYNSVSILKNTINASTISSFIPAIGDSGTVITINGTMFIGAAAVYFGDTKAVSFTILSDTVIKATVGRGSSGAIKIITPNSTATLTGFTFAEPPIINSFFPASATVGAPITIIGSNFTDSTQVSIGGISAVAVSFVSSSEIIALVGAGGSGNINVSTLYGSAAISGFIFKNPPRITSFSPVSGPVGTQIKVSGSNFNPNTDSNIIRFGSVKANILSANDTSIIAVVPPGALYEPFTLASINSGFICYSPYTFNVTFSSGPKNFTSNSFSPLIPIGTLVPAYFGISNLSIGDFDDDGKPDLVVGDAVGVSIFKNLSTTNSLLFKPVGDYSAGGDPTVNSVTDLDGDGKSDIIAGSTLFKNNSVTGNILFNSSQIGGYNIGNEMITADFDGDGKNDFVTNTLNLPAYRNISALGTLSFARSVNLGPDVPDIISGDLDGDGKPDIILGGYSSTIYKNTSSVGSISFTKSINVLGALALGDLDGDGKLDIVAHIGDVSVGLADSSITILQNKSTAGNIAFDTVIILHQNLSDAPLGVIIADMNGDGFPDLIVPNSESNGFINNFITIFKNTSTIGHLSFEKEITYSIPDNSITGLATGVHFNLAVGDMDRDGKPDIIINAVDTLYIMRNQIGEPIASRLCSMSNNSIISSITGINYQWQVNSGTGFNPLNNNSIYSGTNSDTLLLKNIPSNYYGYQYRCIVDGNNSEVYSLKFTNSWTGSADSTWENPANWSCGVLPDANTDVVVNSGTVVLSSTQIIRSLTINPNVSFTIRTPYKLTVTH